MRITPFASLLSLAVFAGSCAARAATPTPSCTVQVDPAEFDLYDVFNTAPTRTTGDIRVHCTAGASPTQVQLSAGLSANFQQRTLVGSGSSLAYNLYVDLAETRIAGDGTNGTSPLQSSSARHASARKWDDFHYYGKIQPLQAVAPGDYTDQIRVTVVF